MPPVASGPSAPPLVVVHPDEELLARAAASRMLLTLLDAQSLAAEAHVALTGGGIGTRMLAAVATDPLRDIVDWSGVHVWWGDERFLPAGHEERNETQARQALLDELAVPAENVHAVPAADEVDDAKTAAAAYAVELADHAPDGRMLPDFRLVLLGMGPDGHIASLFPQAATLEVDDVATTTELDSPKPPPQRVSLTMPALCSAEQVWLLVNGEGKAPATAAALSGRGLSAAGEPEPGELLPAGRVRGRRATLWLVDVAAASGAPRDPEVA